jgi:repressor LexA
MINAGILDGDMVLVRPRQEASDGSIVVALVDHEEATVKRLRRQNGRVQLIAENPAYEPIVPEHVQLVGDVKAVIRVLN